MYREREDAHKPLITTEMLKAGQEALCFYEPGWDDPASVVAETYEAMEGARSPASS